jgi:hypothetical protein
MRRRSRRLVSALAATVVVLTGCDAKPDVLAEQPSADAPADQLKLGLMTSLPLYWPEGADLAVLASGEAPLPWQRRAMEARFALVPLDTLSPIPALSSGAAEVDPLAGLDRLAIIQPRGLSPADNVALDRWVRAGGRLLLVLDPALTGEYAVAIGDPRRPVDTALIPPVVARWGMEVGFDEGQSPAVVTARLDGAALPMVQAGRIALADAGLESPCSLLADGAAARCARGNGQVTLIADAALFEHPELAGEGAARLLAILTATLN